MVRFAGILVLLANVQLAFIIQLPLGGGEQVSAAAYCSVNWMKNTVRAKTIIFMKDFI
jgi:hypothetical protein